MAILFPQIAHYSIGVQQYYNTRDSLVNYIAFVYQAKDDFPEEEEQKLKKWLSVQFPNDSLAIVPTGAESKL
jgi:hypothetical protein